MKAVATIIDAFVRRSRRGDRDDTGALSILFAIVCATIFSIAALSVDLSHARDVRLKAQESADAAALAGGDALYTNSTTAKITDAVAAIKTYASSNYSVSPAEWAACVDPGALGTKVSDSQCISFRFNATTGVSTVRVRMPDRSVSTPFASLLGNSSVTVGGAAEASLKIGGRAACGVCLLGDMEHDFQNGTLGVTGTSVAANGSFAVSKNGALQVTGGSLSVEDSFSGSGTYSPSPTVTGTQVPDPLAFLTMPDYSALTNKSSGSPCSLGPGKYGDFAKFDTCTLSPGLYVITGLWKLAGKESMVGNGVTLYFTCGTPASPRACAAGEKGGELDAAGNGGIGITAPTSGPQKGLVMVADRENAGEMKFTGNASVKTTGTIYMKSALFSCRGNCDGAGLDSLTVVKTLDFRGNPSKMALSYSEAKNVEIPPADLHLSR